MKYKHSKDLDIARGDRLRECRGKLGLSQYDLVDKLSELGIDDCSEKALSAYECGNRPIPNERFVPLAVVLDTNPAYLMCISDDKSPLPDAENIKKLIDISESPLADIQKLVEMRYDFYKPDILCPYFWENCIVQFLISLGYQIQFTVANMYGDDAFYTADISDFSQLGFMYGNFMQTIRDGETQREVVIVDAIINDTRISYKLFLFALSQIYEQVKYTMDNLYGLGKTLNYCQDAEQAFLAMYRTKQNYKDYIKTIRANEQAAGDNNG